MKTVAKQPCLVCRRRPADAHHLRFAQPPTLGRKVSDEFTVLSFAVIVVLPPGLVARPILAGASIQAKMNR